MRPGATPHEVFDATAAYIAGHQAALTTPLAREAAAAAVAHPGSWSIMHGLGLDMAGGQGFFVEDTWGDYGDGARAGQSVDSVRTR